MASLARQVKAVQLIAQRLSEQASNLNTYGNRTDEYMAKLDEDGLTVNDTFRTKHRARIGNMLVDLQTTLALITPGLVDDGTGKLVLSADWDPSTAIDILG